MLVSMNKLCYTFLLMLAPLVSAQSNLNLSDEQRSKLIQRFDKNGDGWLNAEERASAKEAFQQRSRSANDREYVPYRYLENDGITIYYETKAREAYKKLIPEPFSMPKTCVVHAFMIDFYKIDHGLNPYKENAINILVEYKGQQYWHCVYMPVTDRHSMQAGIQRLGLPKTLGEIELERGQHVYKGRGVNPDGGMMSLRINTRNYQLNDAAKARLIELSQLSTVQILRGEVIVSGRTSGQSQQKRSIIEAAERYPNRLIMKFGEASLTLKPNAGCTPLQLRASKILGAYYLKNTIPFSLTRSPLR